jgi:hypothetical protein
MESDIAAKRGSKLFIFSTALEKRLISFALVSKILLKKPKAIKTHLLSSVGHSVSVTAFRLIVPCPAA